MTRIATEPSARASAKGSPLLLWTAGLLGLAGCAALTLGNIAGSLLVPGHDWISDTVSDLAAGRYAAIQDVAIYAYAVGLIACALGAAHLHLGGRRWTLGVLSLTVLALIVTVIAAREAYSAGRSGMSVHLYLVAALGLFSALAPLAMARDLGVLGRARMRLAYGVAAIWAAGGPVFFLLPTGWDGLWERALGLASAAFVASLAWMFLEAARAAPERERLAPA